jgi:hypothetical protein
LLIIFNLNVLCLPGLLLLYFLHHPPLFGVILRIRHHERVLTYRKVIFMRLRLPQFVSIWNTVLMAPGHRLLPDLGFNHLLFLSKSFLLFGALQFFLLQSTSKFRILVFHLHAPVIAAVSFKLSKLVLVINVIISECRSLLLPSLII